MYYKNYFGQFRALDGLRYLINLRFPDPHGLQPHEQEEVTFGGTPLLISYEAEDRLGGIVTSKASLQLLSTRDGMFQHLYSLSGRDVALIVYSQPEPNKLTPVWCGTLDPETYEEPYNTREGYIVTLGFSDFSPLKRVDFEPKGLMSIKQIVEQCLGQMFKPCPEEPKWVSTWLMKSGKTVYHTKTYALTKNPKKVDRSPLSPKNTTAYMPIEEAGYLDTALFLEKSHDPEEPDKKQSCFDVLDQILRSLNLRLEQLVANFCITSLEYAEGGTLPLEVGSNDGNMLTERVYNKIELSCEQELSELQHKHLIKIDDYAQSRRIQIPRLDIDGQIAGTLCINPRTQEYSLLPESIGKEESGVILYYDPFQTTAIIHKPHDGPSHLKWTFTSEPEGVSIWLRKPEETTGGPWSLGGFKRLPYPPHHMTDEYVGINQYMYKRSSTQREPVPTHWKRHSPDSPELSIQLSPPITSYRLGKTMSELCLFTPAEIHRMSQKSSHNVIAIWGIPLPAARDYKLALNLSMFVGLGGTPFQKDSIQSISKSEMTDYKGKEYLSKRDEAWRARFAQTFADLYAGPASDPRKYRLSYVVRRVDSPDPDAKVDGRVLNYFDLYWVEVQTKKTVTPAAPYPGFKKGNAPEDNLDKHIPLQFGFSSLSYNSWVKVRPQTIEMEKGDMDDVPDIVFPYSDKGLLIPAPPAECTEVSVFILQFFALRLHNPITQKAFEWGDAYPTFVLLKDLELNILRSDGRSAKTKKLDYTVTLEEQAQETLSEELLLTNNPEASPLCKNLLRNQGKGRLVRLALHRGGSTKPKGRQCVPSSGEFVFGRVDSLFAINAWYQYGKRRKIVEATFKRLISEPFTRFSYVGDTFLRQSEEIDLKMGTSFMSLTQAPDEAEELPKNLFNKKGLD